MKHTGVGWDKRTEADAVQAHGYARDIVQLVGRAAETDSGQGEG